MLDSFSIQAVKIIEDAKKIANQMKDKIVGTEHLLLAMYDTSDSICRFLLQEEKIKRDDIISIINKMVIIHKVEHPNIVFSNKFQEVVLRAKEVAALINSEYVFDEHLFYSLLEDKETIGHEILEMLSINCDEMLHDVEDIFNFYEYQEKDEKTPFPFLNRLTTSKRQHPFIKRKDYLERIIYILSKKQKNNPLLIGNAGVGKTAIVEGLTDVLKDEVIYQLDLGSIVAGTKYRGELEEKLIKAMEYVKEQKAIVFIDEIHNIVGAGSNDGSLDIANILKPYLSKSDLRLIGATTLDEYYRFIEKDKALIRRFQNIFIDEPSPIETYKILKRIKHSYEEYHHIRYSNKLLMKIITKCSIYIPNRTFPDKAIDVLDEVGSRASQLKTVNLNNLIDQVIADMNGITPKKVDELIDLKLNFPMLIPYYIRFIERIEKINNVVTIGVDKDFDPSYIFEDLQKVFGIKKEMYLEIDLENYNDHTSLNNLIGSSKGYVGYEQGGILTEHLIKYPFSVVYFKNINLAHFSIINYIDKLFKNEVITDNKGRKIFLSNTVFIINKNIDFSNSLGFDNPKHSNKLLKYDIELTSNKEDLKDTLIIRRYEKLSKKYHLKKQGLKNFELYQEIYNELKH